MSEDPRTAAQAFAAEGSSVLTTLQQGRAAAEAIVARYEEDESFRREFDRDPMGAALGNGLAPELTPDFVREVGRTPSEAQPMGDHYVSCIVTKLETVSRICIG